MKDIFRVFTTADLEGLLVKKRRQIIFLTAVEDLDLIEEEITVISEILRERKNG